MPELDPSTIHIGQLPGRTQELVSIVGIQAALKIVELRGGIRLSVPRRIRPDHWLVPHIGLAALTKLVEYYNGEEIEIDRCAAALRTFTEQEILESWNCGISNNALARQYGYTARGMRKLRRRLERQRDYRDMQKDLFD